MARYIVQHFVLAVVVRKQTGRDTFDLFGVDHSVTVPADVEFPHTLSRLELFVRFFVHRPGPVRPVVRVERLGGHSDPQFIYRSRFELSNNQPGGRTVYECGLKLVNLIAPGEGEYAVRLYGSPGPVWQRPRRPLLATEFFRVRKLP